MSELKGLAPTSKDKLGCWVYKNKYVFIKQLYGEETKLTSSRKSLISLTLNCVWVRGRLIEEFCVKTFTCKFNMQISYVCMHF